MGRKNTFPKSFRLKSSKQIDELFQSSESVLSHPLLIKFNTIGLDSKTSVNLRVCFSVSKKNFPNSVSRNRIKRLLREVFRHLKQEFIDQLPLLGSLNMVIIYIDKVLPEYNNLYKAMAKGMSKLVINPKITNLPVG